jgi:hypothetical protein
MPSKNRLQLKSYIRYQLSQLSARNAHHEIENLCFEIARARVVPNLLPATGPVQAGGDQGRDFESYRTYLAKSPIGTSGFVTTASNDVVGGACSIQKDSIPKIKIDLATIFGSGTRPDRVVYFCEQNVAIARRHDLQRECMQKYGAALEIFDGSAIADEAVGTVHTMRDCLQWLDWDRRARRKPRARGGEEPSARSQEARPLGPKSPR